MAKKPVVKGSPIGYGPGVAMEYETPPVYDNNPDGPSNLPNHDLYAYRRDDLYGKRICLPDNIGKGENPLRPDVTVNTADGVAHSQGNGKNNQYQWGGNDGRWNSNEDWPGGNLTGN